MRLASVNREPGMAKTIDGLPIPDSYMTYLDFNLTGTCKSS